MFNPQDGYRCYLGDGVLFYEKGGKFFNSKGEEIPNPLEKKIEKFVCDRCGAEFDSQKKLQGHKIHCKSGE